MVGTFAGALGALGAGLPALLAAHAGLAMHQAGRAVFLAYAGCGLLVLALYLGLPRAPGPSLAAPARPLARSRAVVLKLAAGPTVAALVVPHLLGLPWILAAQQRTDRGRTLFAVTTVALTLLAVALAAVGWRRVLAR